MAQPAVGVAFEQGAGNGLDQGRQAGAGCGGIGVAGGQRVEEIAQPGAGLACGGGAQIGPIHGCADELLGADGGVAVLGHGAVEFQA